MDGKEKTKYRNTKEWKKFRKELLEDADYKCQVCGIRKKKKLQIHHLNEKAYGQETKESVVILCPTCHKIVEWLLSRTRNPVDLNDFCSNLKWVYETTREEGKLND